MHRPSIHVPPPTVAQPATGVRPRHLAAGCHARLVTCCLSPDSPDDRGQTTAEYVLLILGAATIAILVTSWASATDKVSRLFDRVLNSLTNKVG